MQKNNLRDNIVINDSVLAGPCNTCIISYKYLTHIIPLKMKHALFCWLPLALIPIASDYGQVAKANNDSLFTIEKVTALGPEYNFIRPMVGNWQGQQRIWSKAGASPMSSGFIAKRRLVGHFLEEIMEPAPGSDIPPFTRTTYLNYNNANQRWEYVVLDTRYPVMMYETSDETMIKNGSEITLYLPAFIMPPGWNNDITGKLGKQRRTITNNGDTTVVRQYWTPPAGKEFLAIEYTYTHGKN